MIEAKLYVFSITVVLWQKTLMAVIFSIFNFHMISAVLVLLIAKIKKKKLNDL